MVHLPKWNRRTPLERSTGGPMTHSVDMSLDPSLTIRSEYVHFDTRASTVDHQCVHVPNSIHTRALNLSCSRTEFNAPTLRPEDIFVQGIAFPVPAADSRVGIVGKAIGP